MATIRSGKCKGETTGFVQIDNDVLDNMALSLAAKGLMCYMLRHKDDWHFSIENLTRRTGYTKHTIRQAMNNLKECNYVRCEQKRLPDGANGNWEYTIIERPTDAVFAPRFVKPKKNKPGRD